MCKHDFDFLCSLFMSLYPLYPFYIFSFCGRQGCFPLLLRIPQFGMRKSDLRSSFGTKCLVKLFLSFFAKYVFYWTKGHLRCWTIKRSFDFERRETLRHLTISWGGRQKRGFCSYVSSMRNSDLRSSFFLSSDSFLLKSFLA